MRHAAIILAVVCLASSAFAADMEITERNAFYEGPQLFVMTGYIANTTSGTWGADFIVEGEWSREKQLAKLDEWNKGLGKDYDPDKVVKDFKDAGATGVIFYDKWHDGNVPHKTKYTTYMTERDLVGDTLKALKKHNMKAIVYYSLGFDANPDPKFKDWVCLDPDGKPMGRCFPGDWMSFNSPYRDFVTDHLVEILTKYGPFDGFYLDILGQPVPLSRDRHTKAEFQKVYGKPVEEATERETQDFLIHTYRSFLQHIREKVSAVQPNVGFNFNGAGRSDASQPKRMYEVDDLVDWFSIEGHGRERIDSIATAGQLWDRPFETGILLNTSWYVPMSDEAPPASMSKEEAVVSTASVFIRGGNVFAAMTPGHSGKYSGEGDLGLLRAAGDWLKGNKEWIVGSKPYAEIGILRGNPSKDLLMVPPLGTIWDRTHRHRAQSAGSSPGSETDLTLRRLGYLTQLAGSAHPRRPVDPNDYRLVVLPENAPMGDDLAAQIREYVRNGGNVLAFGYASLYDENAELRQNFALADVFGVDRAGDLPGYKYLTPLPDSGMITTLRGNPGALGVRATTGKVLARWRFADDAPAIIENKFGKGRCIYITGEELAFGTADDVLGELTARLIGEPAVQVKGDREYSLIMNRKGDDLLLYLVNNTTGSRSNTGGAATGAPRPTELTTTKEEVNLTLNTDVLGSLSRVESIPSNRKIEFSRRSGTVSLYLDASPSVTTVRLVK